MSQFVTIAICEQPYMPIHEKCIALLAGHAIAGGSAFLILVFTCQLIDLVVVSLLGTLQIAMSFIAKYTILTSVYPGKGNQMELIGAVLFFVCNVISPAIKVYAYVK